VTWQFYAVILIDIINDVVYIALLDLTICIDIFGRKILRSML